MVKQSKQSYCIGSELVAYQQVVPQIKRCRSESYAHRWCMHSIGNYPLMAPLRIYAIAAINTTYYGRSSHVFLNFHESTLSGNHVCVMKIGAASKARNWWFLHIPSSLWLLVVYQWCSSPYVCFASIRVMQVSIRYVSEIVGLVPSFNCS